MSGQELKHALEVALARHPEIRTMSALAEAAHVRRATIYAWFAGTLPRPRQLGRVADVLGVPLAELWAAVGVIQPENAEERRLAELIVEAYERGLHEGQRIERERIEREGSR